MDSQTELFRYLNQSEHSSTLSSSVSPLIVEAKKVWKDKTKYRRLNLDEEKIIKLYIEKKLSQCQLSKLFGCSREVFVRILKKNNISIRSNRINFSKKEIKKIIFMYCVKKYSTLEIGRELGYSKLVINRVLRNNNIERRKTGNVKGKPQPNISKAFKKLYNEGKLKSWNKGKKLSYPVWNEGIKGKKYLSHFKNGNVWNKGITWNKSNSKHEKFREKIIELWEQEKYINDIAREISMGRRFVLNCLDYYGLNRHKRMDRTKFKKGIIVWNKGFTKYNHPTLQLVSEIGKKRFLNEEFVKKLMNSMSLKPNKPEKLLISLFKKHNLPYNYTGNFSFWIEGKNPDFVHKSHKKIIEFFGDYWHDGVKNVTEEQRKNHFSKYGYKTLIIWDYELKNIDNVLQKITQFTNQ